VRMVVKLRGIGRGGLRLLRHDSTLCHESELLEVEVGDEG